MSVVMVWLTVRLPAGLIIDTSICRIQSNSMWPWSDNRSFTTGVTISCWICSAWRSSKPNSKSCAHYRLDRNSYQEYKKGGDQTPNTWSVLWCYLSHLTNQTSYTQVLKRPAWRMLSYLLFVCWRTMVFKRTRSLCTVSTIERLLAFTIFSRSTVPTTGCKCFDICMKDCACSDTSSMHSYNYVPTYFRKAIPVHSSNQYCKYYNCMECYVCVRIDWYILYVRIATCLCTLY